MLIHLHTPYNTTVHGTEEQAQSHTLLAMLRKCGLVRKLRLGERTWCLGITSRFCSQEKKRPCSREQLRRRIRLSKGLFRKVF